MKYLTVLLLFVLACTTIDAKRQKGEVSTSKDDWVFLSKFAFSKGEGNLTWRITTSKPQDLLLVFYIDEGDNWNNVWKHHKDLTCWEKVAMAHGNRTIIPDQTRVQPFKDDIRPHYWYFAIANCMGGSILDVQYSFNFTNSGNMWKHELSADEQGLPQAYLIFWLAFLAMVAAHGFGIFGLIREKSYHPIVRIVTICLVLEFISIMFIWIHYMVYLKNGVGAPGLQAIGDILDFAFQLIFMFLMILLAKGYAITKNELTDRLALIIIFGLFCVLYLAMFIWEWASRNPASPLFVYESAPGIIILILRVLFLGWFLWCLRKSRQEESHPTKHDFYLKFGAFFSAWFVILPFIVIIAAVTSPWTRLRIVISMYLTMNTLALAALVYLLWPTKAQEYFTIVKSDLLLGGKSTSPYETL